MKTDIEIAESIKLKRIGEIADMAGIGAENILPYGHYMAKIPLEFIDEERAKKSNLVLVTSITPCKAGNGKTTVSLGLTLALNRIGKRAIVALREPSLGPCFGMKGGAAGGGYSQALPMENINLHFTGDFHAITSANNMIAALLDNHIYQNRFAEGGMKQILWRRVMDVNDRSLRNIITGLGGQANGVPTETGFDITPASEIMAIFCLSTSFDDLRRRIGKVLLGFTADGEPVTVDDLGVTGSITLLLKDAIKPNLVQTTENTPAIIHGGPFANIAHGCNSILATKMAMTYGEYTITEAGFGADLGAEKFFDIKCRKAGLCPKATVIVATAQALKMHGGVDEKLIKEPNIEGLKRGFANLDKHIRNMQSYGQSVIVTFNRYATDTDEEMALVRQRCEEIGVGFAENNVFAEGGKGGEQLAHLLVDTIENNPSKPMHFCYEDTDSVEDKIWKVCSNIYGAASVEYSSQAKNKLKLVKKMGVEHYPVCIAKTQYSFSADPKAYGYVKDFPMQVRDIVINNGSEMIVVIMGDMMRMPGLPKSPQANRIDIIDGKTIGLS